MQAYRMDCITAGWWGGTRGYEMLAVQGQAKMVAMMDGGKLPRESSWPTRHSTLSTSELKPWMNSSAS